MTKDEFYNLYINVNSIVDLAMMKSLAELDSMTDEELDAEFSLEQEQAGAETNQPMKITEYTLTPSDLADESKASILLQMSEGKTEQEITYIKANFEECAEKYFVEKINEHNLMMFNQVKQHQQDMQNQPIGHSNEPNGVSSFDEDLDLGELMPDLNDYMEEVNESKPLIKDRLESAFSLFKASSVSSSMETLMSKTNGEKTLLTQLKGSEIEYWLELYLSEDTCLHDIAATIRQLDPVEY